MEQLVEQSLLENLLFISLLFIFEIKYFFSSGVEQKDYENLTNG